MPDTDVRVRFAPSPTGQLHVGSARTALYNWAFARHHGGTMILRIDDTDPERSTRENTQAILDALDWLGINWDEGPDVGGSHGPYFQTQRGDIYREALASLVASGSVYPCFCSVEELQKKRTATQTADGYAGYDRTCRDIDPAVAESRINAGESFAWRLAVPLDRGDVVFTDAVRGELSFPAEVLDDLIVVRSDGSPTYNFATVVDDADMGITHVIRGEDHTSNTPRQILIFEALGHDVPRFAHMSLTFGPDGKRLSKRHGATSVEAFRAMGFLPDALVNYIALLGWSLDDKTTIMDRSVLVEHFSLERLSRNPGIFDIEKLEWMNGVYIRELPVALFADLVSQVILEAGMASPDDIVTRRAWYETLAHMMQERTKRLDEIPEAVAFLFGDAIVYDETSVDKVLRQDRASEILASAISALESLPGFSAIDVEESLRALPEVLGVKPKVVFQTVRVGISGSTVSPPLFESLELLGRERSIARLHKALEMA